VSDGIGRELQDHALGTPRVELRDDLQQPHR